MEGGGESGQPLLLREDSSSSSPTRRKKKRLHQYQFPRSRRKASGMLIPFFARGRAARLLGGVLAASVVAGIFFLVWSCPDSLCSRRGEETKPRAAGASKSDLSDSGETRLNSDPKTDNVDDAKGGTAAGKKVANLSGGAGFVVDSMNNNSLPRTSVPVNFVNYEDIQDGDFEFDMNGNDVMVFLHMQKTGGTTFGKHLVKDVDLEQPCQCKKTRRKQNPLSRQHLDKPRKKMMRCR